MESQRCRWNFKLQTCRRAERKERFVSIPVIIAIPPTPVVYERQLRPDADIPCQSVGSADGLVVGVVYPQYGDIVAEQYLRISRVGAIKEMLDLWPYECRPITQVDPQTQGRTVTGLCVGLLAAQEQDGTN